MKINLRASLRCIIFTAALLAVQSTSAFYDPNVGRWLNRDPIGESGFNLLVRMPPSFSHNEEGNLYCFVRNSPLSNYDPLGLCVCAFKGSTGKLTVDPSCKGVLSIWVIDENNAAAAGATTGTTVSADGYVLNGTTYKIDGSTCVEMKCTKTTVSVSTCVNNLAKCFSKGAPSAVPAGTFGGPPKEPASGSTPPVAK